MRRATSGALTIGRALFSEIVKRQRKVRSRLDRGAFSAVPIHAAPQGQSDDLDDDRPSVDKYRSGGNPHPVSFRRRTVIDLFFARGRPTNPVRRNQGMSFSTRSTCAGLPRQRTLIFTVEISPFQLF